MTGATRSEDLRRWRGLAAIGHDDGSSGPNLADADLSSRIPIRFSRMAIETTFYGDYARTVVGHGTLRDGTRLIRRTIASGATYGSFQLSAYSFQN